MKLKQVESSSIWGVGYNKKKQELIIEFISGGVYKYSGVQQNVYDGLMSAESHGEYFCQTIKGCFEYEKI